MKKDLFRKKVNRKDSGAAMIVVVCILMVTMILCLTMVVGAYQMMASVNDTRRDTAVYQQAFSFSKAMIPRLEATDAEVPATSGLLTEIADFATDPDLFVTDAEGNVSEPVRSFTAKPSGDGIGGENYDDIRLILRKTKLSDRKCNLYLTAQILDGDRVMSECTAGYLVKTRDDGGTLKYDLSFKAFY
ncbi:MAG: hypothetical protein K6E84_08150 [Lachnospiraceae bacterium]|nr:hypothetical protein [Lachnospiraceae bacterium]